MFAYALPSLVCGSCGYPLLCVNPQGWKAPKANGVVQMICAHRECADYDKPMEFDLPKIELRPTTSPEILAEVNKKAPLLVLSHPERHDH